MIIKVLGTGCPKCKKLYAEAQKAIEETGVEAQLIKVEQIDDIIACGVMMTPALVIDDAVKSTGKILSSAQISKMIKTE